MIDTPFNLLDIPKFMHSTKGKNIMNETTKTWVNISKWKELQEHQMAVMDIRSILHPHNAPIEKLTFRQRILAMFRPTQFARMQVVDTCGSLSAVLLRTVKLRMSDEAIHRRAEMNAANPAPLSGVGMYGGFGIDDRVTIPPVPPATAHHDAAGNWYPGNITPEEASAKYGGGYYDTNHRWIVNTEMAITNTGRAAISVPFKVTKTKKVKPVAKFVKNLRSDEFLADGRVVRTPYKKSTPEYRASNRAANRV